jgi:murein DD-endopeptidase MepM/ murein hydrolase activator NlpD
MIDVRFTKLAIRMAIGLVILLTPGRSAFSQATPEPSEVMIHIIQDGETLDSIAGLYGTTVQAIQQANTISDPRDIFVGQRVIVPVASSASTIPASQQTVVVGLGDSVTTLAAQYNIPPEQLGRANKVVNPLRLYAGQAVVIPQSVPQPASGLAIVSSTNSFWSIAFRANANAVALGLSNNISNPFILAPGSIIVLADTVDSTPALPFPWVSLVLHPLPLEQGRTGGLRLSATAPGVIKATFLSRDLQVISSETSHEAVFGIDRWTEPGLYPLAITLEDEAGTTWTFTQDVLVTSGDYASEVIRASEETSAILGDPQTVQQESDYIRQNMSGFTLKRHWNDLFLLPVAGVLTSPFGSVRTYSANDTVTFHSGSDLAIKTGTAIYAPADGVVVDAGQLEVRGYATLIDHGIGVYSGYWHQSSILVRPGDEVVAGQQIGTVGSTGFSTASHLHWELWVGGIQVDPMQWVREVFP